MYSTAVYNDSISTTDLEPAPAAGAGRARGRGAARARGVRAAAARAARDCCAALRSTTAWAHCYLLPRVRLHLQRQPPEMLLFKFI